jgi:membrane-bound lytic murein transglycosylase D
MPVRSPLAAPRRGRSRAPLLLLAALFAALLLASGCASHKKTQYAYDDAEFDGVVSAREYGYVRPADDVWVLGEASRQSPKSRRGGDGGGDLWGRVRAGMQLDLAANPRIESKVKSFRRDPQYLVKLSERAHPYLRVIMDEIDRRGLPAEIALLPYVESRYNPAATSHKAAAGMWQFIPSTGRIMGLRQDGWTDDRRDVLASTRAALDYLEQLNRQLGGDWELAMAAYNCGPGRIESAQAANRKRGKPTDFWSLDLPAETENYVPQILAAARLVAEPAAHGLRLPAIPHGPQLEVVRSDRPMDLAKLSQTSGVPLADLRRLNAGLKRGQTTPGEPAHLVVPAGAGQRVTARLKSARVLPAMASLGTSSRPARALPTRTRESEPRAGSYTASFDGEGTVRVVKVGESLSSIAATQGIDPESLAEFNAMRVDEPLLPGQSLRIPGGNPKAVVSYRVREGDSLDDIARRYGVSVGDLKRWNRTAANDLRTGEVLRIYRRGEASAS